MRHPLDKLEPFIEEGPDGLLYDRRFREHLAGQAADTKAGEALAAVRHASHGFKLMMNRWLERHGLGEARLAVLWRLQRGGDANLGDLAVELDVSARNVTGLVDHLERDGLVERSPDPLDRRAVRVRLSPLGRAKLAGIRNEMALARDQVVTGFSDEELDLLRHLCLKLTRNMNEKSRQKERELEKV